MKKIVAAAILCTFLAVLVAAAAYECPFGPLVGFATIAGCFALGCLTVWAVWQLIP